jgi:hypothetical protein
MYPLLGERSIIMSMKMKKAPVKAETRKTRRTLPIARDIPEASHPSKGSANAFSGIVRQFSGLLDRTKSYLK